MVDLLPSLLLTSEECDYLLSLTESGLEEFLGQLTLAEVEAAARQLSEHQTPRERLNQVSLYEYAKAVWPVLRPEEPYIDGDHIRVICEHLEHATDTPHYNLVATIPPGCMKSILVSVIWPTWVWGPRGWRGARFLFASYSERFAGRDLAECRKIINSVWYQENWQDVDIDRSSPDNSTEFHLDGGGYRIATGTGGRGTGEHPHFIVGDDVSKADHSEVEFKAAITWWSRTMSTRGRIVGSRRVMVGQRLRINDAPQWCIQAGYDWLCLPMRAWKPGLFAGDGAGASQEGASFRPKPTALGWIDERAPGALLWEEAYPEAVVRQLEDELGVNAPAQLQQAPIRIAAGGYFPRAKVVEYLELDMLPMKDLDKIVRYWDKAGGESAASDRSAGALWARWRQRGGVVKYVILDLVVGRWNPFERDEIISQTAMLDRRQFGGKAELWMEEEMGGAGRQSADISRRDLASFGIRTERPQTNKGVRARGLSSVWHAGNVVCVVAPWNRTFLDEMEQFTGEEEEGVHDDIPDACSGAVNQILLTPPKSGGLPKGYSPGGFAGGPKKPGRM